MKHMEEHQNIIKLWIEKLLLKKHLTRLRSSEWIVKMPKDRKDKVSKWKMCPTAIKMYNDYLKALEASGDRFQKDLIHIWESSNGIEE